MNLFNIANAFERNKVKGWPIVYWAIDIHDTIGRGTYKKDNDGFDFYPWAKEVLLNLSRNPKCKIIIYTASHTEPARNLIKWMEGQGITIFALNENPDHKDNELCDFRTKFYFDILLEDKAGFEASDWFLIMKELQRINQWDYNITEYKGDLPLIGHLATTEKNITI